MSTKLVAIYCASSAKIDSAYLNHAKELGALLVQNNLGIKYGGGSIGSMGAIANEMLHLNGRVVGVIPQFMVDVEWAHPQVKEMIVCTTMAQRKEILLADVDAIVVMAGGVGTFDEMFDALSLKKLGKFHKPIIILNTKNYFTPILEILEQSIHQQFMHQDHRNMWQVANTPSEVIHLIQTTPHWESNTLANI